PSASRSSSIAATANFPSVPTSSARTSPPRSSSLSTSASPKSMARTASMSPGRRCPMLETELRELSSEQTLPAWRRKDLLDTDTLTPAEIDLIMETAEAMREVRSRPVGKVATLRGETVVTLFYEQSTRTRASFEVAAKALGADVVNLPATGSSVEKGESLIDTVRTLEAIGADMVVMRHKSSGAPYIAARHTRTSVING